MEHTIEYLLLRIEAMEKEIETETFTKSITEITLEQIADKFGLDVEQIRIKP